MNDTRLNGWHDLLRGGALEFVGEVRLEEWSKSSSREPPKVRFAVSDDNALEPFIRSTVRKKGVPGQLYRIMVVRMDEPEPSLPPPSPPKKVRSCAQRLHASGYFRRKGLWDKLSEHGIYTIDDHRNFVSQQRCFFGDEDHFTPHGQDSVIAVKAPGASQWLYLPACEDMADSIRNPEDLAAKERILTYAITLISSGVQAAIKKKLGVESFSDVTEDMMAKFNRSIGFV